MKTLKFTADLYLKQNVISNILMLTDYLPNYKYEYKTLIKLSLSDLEYLRDSLIPEYNEIVKAKNNN